jgi:hypothetical protein
MLLADALTGSQIMGFLAIRFNGLSGCGRASRGRVD